MYSIIFRYTINHEYPLFITYLTLPLNLYWKQFVSTCDIVIMECMFVVCEHFLCQRRKVSPSDNTFAHFLFNSCFPGACADLNRCPELLLTNTTGLNFLTKLIYHSIHTTVVAAQGHVNRFICRKHTEDLCRIFGYIISLRLLNSLLFQDLRLFLDTVYSI